MYYLEAIIFRTGQQNFLPFWVVFGFFGFCLKIKKKLKRSQFPTNPGGVACKIRPSVVAIRANLTFEN